MSSPEKKRPGSLSSGNRLGVRLRNKKPSLAVDGTVEQTSGGGGFNALASIIRGLAATVVILLTLVVSGWLIVGLTIFPTIQVSGTPWVVKWAAWPEGSVPLGSTVMASDKPREFGLGSRLSLLFGGSGNSVVKVIAGPGGEIKAGPDLIIYYNDEPTELLASTPFPSTRLGDQYLVQCLLPTPCLPENKYAVPVNYILGEVLGSLRLSPSLGPLPEPTISQTPFIPPVPTPDPSASGAPSPSSSDASSADSTKPKAQQEDSE